MGVPWTPANCLTPGGDALVSDYPYHYEIELDIMGWVGPSYIRCQNGPSTLINFGPGADFVCHFNLPDSGGSGSAVGPMLIGGIGPRCTPGTQETGPLCRQHANFLTVPVAWGFSITEHPEPDAISVSRGNCIMVSGDQAIGVTVKVTDCDAVAVPAISDRGLLALGLVGIGATFVALRRGRPRRRSSGATG